MKIPFTKEKADWVKVLELMYDNQEAIIGPDKIIPEVTPEILNGLTRELQMEQSEILDALRYLKSNQLIKMEISIEQGEKAEIEAYGGLTTNGLQLAHQIKSERQRRNTNIILSGGIILVSLLIFIAQILPIIIQ